MALTDRQRELADVGLTLIESGGLASVSYRTIATASGWSLGAVQKAFANKDEIVQAMFARLREAAVPLPPGEPGRPNLRVWLLELMLLMLPLDDARRAAYARASAFTDRASFDSAIAAAIAASDAEITGQLSALIRRAQAEGEIDPTLDPDSTVQSYLDFAQGMAARLLYAPEAEADVRARVQRVVDMLFV